MARYIADLDPRELHEQIRDWAVIATVTRLGASAEQAAAATYELPPARLPYLDELYAFEYGRGRRTYLGSRILLFRDADDPDPQATIGRLADRVREENGVIPTRVEIYLIHDQRDEGSIRLDRAADVTGAELFSPAYGYVEASADSAAELEAWLSQADDLSFAQLGAGHLVLGGRRFVKTRTANVTLDDVAALYQAHERLGAPLKRARATLRGLSPARQQIAARAVELLKAGKREPAMAALRSLAYQLSSVQQMNGLMEAIRVTASPARGPGFSLDPEWLPDPSAPHQPLMLARMQTFLAHPCAEVDAIAKRATELEQAEPDPTRYTSLTRRALWLRTNLAAITSTLDKASVCRALEDFVPRLADATATIAKAAASHWDTALAGYYQLKAQLAEASPDDPHSAIGSWLTRSAFSYYESETQTQCARYDETTGTRVGMTMFYTDLLAKLWMGIDHGASAPTLDVAGFIAMPRLDLSAQVAADKNKNTRVWFGPRTNSVSRAASNGSAILFEHSFARIYAAGSDPAHPGTEASPNEESRRAIGWWDRHYDEVADYEQEFHRLNQIMKWSLVTGALSEAEKSQHLQAVPVRQNHGFDAWARGNQAIAYVSQA